MHMMCYIPWNGRNPENVNVVKQTGSDSTACFVHNVYVSYKKTIHCAKNKKVEAISK